MAIYAKCSYLDPADNIEYTAMSICQSQEELDKTIAQMKKQGYKNIIVEEVSDLESEN